MAGHVLFAQAGNREQDNVIGHDFTAGCEVRVVG